MKKVNVSKVFLLSVVLGMTTLDALAAAPIAQSYPVSDITSVNVGGGAILEVSQGDTESLKVEATPEVMQRVSVDVTNHVLTLRVKSSNDFFFWFHRNSENVRYILQVKELTKLDTSGAVQATIDNYRGDKLTLLGSGASQHHFSNLQLNNFEIDLSGASNVDIGTIDTEKLKMVLTGASNFTVHEAGKTRQLLLTASGASNYVARPLIAAVANVDASGASNVEIQVTESLQADASGASNIDYYGAAKAQTKSSGAGHVTKH